MTRYKRPNYYHHRTLPPDMYKVLMTVLLMAALSVPSVNSQTCLPGCECTDDEIFGSKKMDCSNTRFQTIPEIPSHITELEMYRNTFRTLGNNSFASLTNLKKLVLDFCDIEHIELEAFSQLRNLEELDLKNNRIASLPDFIFKDLTSLETLTLSNNLIEGLENNVFSGLTSLKMVDLTANLLTSLPDTVFRQLQNLQDVTLDRNKIDIIPTTVFETNPFLQTVSLFKNKLTSIHPDIFNNSLRLNSVNLEQNRLTTLSGTLFSRNYELTFLNLKDNRFICDCTMSTFRIWATQARLQWNAEQSGICDSPSELQGRFLLNVQPSELICTTTTTTTTTTPTTTTPPTSTKTTQPLTSNIGTKVAVLETIDPMTRNIVIACCVGAVFIIVMIITVACCCCKRKRRNKPRQVKYILKPVDLDLQGEKPTQNGNGHLNKSLDVEQGIPAREGSPDDSIAKNMYSFDGNYKPNIMPTETDLDEDLRQGRDNRLFSSQSQNPTGVYNTGGEYDEGMQFYNSLNKSINGRSSRMATPLSIIHRATPVSHHMTSAPPAYSATNRATPSQGHERSAYKTAGYEPPTPWKDGQYYDHTSYKPLVSTVLNSDNGAGFPSSPYEYPGYLNDQYLPDMDCNGKYSTGSADSGVHSTSPAPRARTPTDFSDHQISPNDQSRLENYGENESAINKKIVKNETYV